MSRLVHLPEPVQPHGGMAAEGALNLLGRPDLDPLVVLVREAAQNSWDARVGPDEPVRFSLVLGRASAEVRGVLTRDVFAELPPTGLGLGADGGRELADALADSELRLLTISDTGTFGLGGPTRADRAAGPDESRDFVDLVFNMGQPRDRALGAGTYGFGKTISYLVSRCRTVIIHTVTEHRGALEHRLIAQALGHRYTHAGRNYTGRHWWGDMTRTGFEPVTGDAAASVASALGLPDLESAGAGTTLAVLDPDLADRTPAQAANFMATALVWNFWPKMVPDHTGVVPMQFSVTCDGADVPVPDPRETSPLAAYVEALEAVRDCEQGRTTPDDYTGLTRVSEISSQRPKARLGWLALVRTTVLPRRQVDEGLVDGAESSAAGFQGPSHHVALMRDAELVVRYQPGPELPHPAVEWAGVFKAAGDGDKAEEIEHAFAQSEPPTHDDWKPNLLPQGWNRRYVNIALREIRDRQNDAFGARAPRPAPGEASGVMIAEALGHLVSAHPGSGASPREKVVALRGGQRATPKVSVQRRWLAGEGGAMTLNVEFLVTAAAASRGTSVTVEARAATGDGRPEPEPPTGAAVPVVLRLSQGEEVVDAAPFRIRVAAGDPTPVVAVLSQPEGVAVAVDINADVDR